jgi:hypothetical protein
MTAAGVLLGLGAFVVGVAGCSASPSAPEAQVDPTGTLHALSSEGGTEGGTCTHNVYVLPPYNFASNPLAPLAYPDAQHTGNGVLGVPRGASNCAGGLFMRSCGGDDSGARAWTMVFSQGFAAVTPNPLRRYDPTKYYALGSTGASMSRGDGNLLSFELCADPTGTTYLGVDLDCAAASDPCTVTLTGKGSDPFQGSEQYRVLNGSCRSFEIPAGMICNQRLVVPNSPTPNEGMCK